MCIFMSYYRSLFAISGGCGSGHRILMHWRGGGDGGLVLMCQSGGHGGGGFGGGTFGGSGGDHGEVSGLSRN